MSPLSEKFIVMYGETAFHVPTYTVWGEFDNSSFAANLGRTIDDYLKKPTFDALGVEYKGRRAITSWRRHPGSLTGWK